MVKYCFYCGKQITYEDDEICPNCGSKRLLTPESHPVSQEKKTTKFAKIWDRWFAYLIDFTIVITVCFVFGLVFFLIIYSFFSILQMPEIGSLVGILMAFILCIPIFCFYFAYYESSEKQATFGKRIMKIKVIDKNGGRIKFKQGLLRSFIKFFTTFSPVGLIALLHAVFLYYHNPERKGIHDIVAGTYVVNNNF